MKAPLSHMDERTAGIIGRICTTMYLVTMAMLIGVITYREFVLGQPISEFEDVAIIVTVNVLVGLAAGLYLIGLNLPRPGLLVLVPVYLGFVALGFGFTMLKDAVFLHKEVDLGFALGKLQIVATICGLMVALYAAIAWLGHRRIEREIS